MYNQPNGDVMRAFLVVVLLLLPGLAQAQSTPIQDTDRQVYVNGQRMEADYLAVLEQRYATRVPDGRYWYDALCGAWGYEGGATAGFMPPGLDLPGPMPASISGGGTGIFINGREIHPQEQLTLYQLLGQTIPGHYWLDAQGYVGEEGGPAFMNLFAIARQAAGTRAGSVYSSNSDSWLTSDGEGGFLFFDRSGGGYTSWGN